jgi:hypothetical protein
MEAKDRKNDTARDAAERTEENPQAARFEMPSDSEKNRIGDIVRSPEPR